MEIVHAVYGFHFFLNQSLLAIFRLILEYGFVKNLQGLRCCHRTGAVFVITQLHHPSALVLHVFNSLFPGRCGGNFKSVIFIWWIDILHVSCKIDFSYMPQISTDDKSTLVQILARCHQATSCDPRLCWPDLWRHKVTMSWIVYLSTIDIMNTSISWISWYIYGSISNCSALWLW